MRTVLARNLTDEERISELDKMGFPMSKRTFVRRKRHFKDDLQFRVNEIASKEFVAYFIDAIDKMTVATDKMMKLLDSSDNQIQFQANRELRENVKLLA